MIWNGESFKTSEKSITARTAVVVAPTSKTGKILQINSNKLYVFVATLSINNNIKFLENMKQEFKITVSVNKYRSEITKQ